LDAAGQAPRRNRWRSAGRSKAAKEVAAAGNFIPLMSVRTPLSLALVADDDRLWTSAEQ
jgi:hypothetical protein